MFRLQSTTVPFSCRASSQTKVWLHYLVRQSSDYLLQLPQTSSASTCQRGCNPLYSGATWYCSNLPSGIS